MLHANTIAIRVNQGLEMKKFFVVAASILAAAMTASVTASAADMPTKAPAQIAGPGWTGFYVNGGLGYGAWTADTTTVNPNTGQCDLCPVQVQGGKGWLGRAGVGYDHQFTSHFVAGLFGDYDFSSLKGTIQDQSPAFAGQIKQNSAWALGARLGWLVNPSVLGYANGGYSSARFSGAHMVETNTLIATAFSTPSDKTHGWFLGGGLEVAVTPNLFWRNEYRYAAYGSRTLPDNDGATGVVDSITFKPTVQTFTTQLVYKLAGAADVTKAYPEIIVPGWTGFYINGGLGYGAWTADTTTVDPIVGGCVLCDIQVQGGRGWLGRVGIGYDHQFTPHVVAGLFGDYDLSSLKGTIQDQNPFFAGQIKRTSAWGLGARAGWLVSPGVLGYANGGYSSARFSGAHMFRTDTLQTTNFSTPAETTHGWFLGGGLEVAVMPHLFWRNEYRYAAYADRTLPDTASVMHSSITFKPTVQTFTTQLAYKFNWLH